MDIATPYLVFLADATDPRSAKTAFGIRDWRPDWVAGQHRLPGATVDLGLPDLTPSAAAAQGAKTLVIGTTSSGGYLPEAWYPTLIDALEAGLDIASGMHAKLADAAPIAEAATRLGRTLFDVRHTARTFATGTGRKRTGKRLLTVGTDCAVGKKYSALAIAQAMVQRGATAEFRATGQTGILIARRGVAMDAVVSDFISGAAEWLSPDNDPDHWDIIEGQGSLFHAAFAAVTVGLLHGSQPDWFVVCHEAGRTTDRHLGFTLPTIGDVIDLTVRVGRLTNPAIACAGLSVNTHAMDDAQATDYLAGLSREYGLPACDPLRTGVAALVEPLLARGTAP